MNPYKVFDDLESYVIVRKEYMTTVDWNAHLERHFYPFHEPGFGVVDNANAAEALVRRAGYAYCRKGST